MINRLISFYRLQLELLWKWRPGRRALLKRGIVSLVVGTVAMLSAVILPGVKIDNLATLVVAVVLLALVNALVRPVILGALRRRFGGGRNLGYVDLPGAGLFPDRLAAAGFPSGRRDSPAFFGPIVFACSTPSCRHPQRRRRSRLLRPLVARWRATARHIVSDKPGVVIVQIDGLAQPILAHQIRAGRVPFMANWIRSGQMKLDKWTALLPSQTSASQAGILHGNNSFIPAFRWWEKDSAADARLEPS